jgi:RNA recognition motif-containing protein
MYKVFIGSLSYNTEEDALSELFSEVEGFENVSIIKDQMTGRSRGFAFAAFATKEGADQACEKFNGYELDGFTLNVDHAKEKKREGGAGGGRPGGRSGGGFGGSRSGGGFGGSRSSSGGGFGGSRSGGSGFSSGSRSGSGFGGSSDRSGSSDRGKRW